MTITKRTAENIVTAILLGLAVLLLCSGCSVKQAQVTKPDGTIVKVTINSFLSNERSEGLSYGRVDGEIMLELGPMGTEAQTQLLQSIVEKLP